MHYLNSNRIQTLGFYRQEAFAITLSPLISVFDTDEDHPSLQVGKDLNAWPVFLHEYWHYLQNTSTVARFQDLHLYLKIRQPVIEVMGITEKGWDRSFIPSTSQRAELDAAIRLIHHHQGDVQLPPIEGLIVACECEILLSEISAFGKVHQVHDCVITFVDEDARRYSFLLGKVAIEEALAYEVEAIAKGDGSGAPLYPYRFARMIAEDQLAREVSSAELTRWLTLAMMTTSAGASFIRILQEVKSSGKTPEDLWQSIREEYVQSRIPECQRLVGDILRAYAGRGFIESSLRIITSRIIENLKTRALNPFFDLELIEDGEKGQLNLLAKIAPCPVIVQSRGDVEEEGRDDIIHFDQSTGGDGISDSFHLTVLSCQQHMTATFLYGQAETDSPCPYYNVCTHKLRSTEAQKCRTKPWMQPEFGATCWYGHAVGGTISKSIS